MGTSEISFFSSNTCVNGHPEYEAGEAAGSGAWALFDTPLQDHMTPSSTSTRLTEMGAAGPTPNIVMNQARKPPDAQTQADIDKGRAAVERIRGFGTESAPKIASVVEELLEQAIQAVRDRGTKASKEGLRIWADWADKTANLNDPNKNPLKRIQIAQPDWQALATQTRDALPKWALTIFAAGMATTAAGRYAAMFMALVKAADFLGESKAPSAKGPLA